MAARPGSAPDAPHRIGGVGGLTAVAAIVLLIVPNTVATAPFATVVKPPFKVRWVGSSDYIISSGNGSINVSKPFFHHLTGVGGYWADAVIPNCSGVCNSIQADYSPSFQGPWLGIELSLAGVPANATSIALKATLAFVATMRVTPGICHFRNISGLESVCGWNDLWLFQVENPRLHDTTANRSYSPSNETIASSPAPTNRSQSYSWEGTQGYVDGCQVVGGANSCFSYSSGPILNRTAVNASWNTTFTVPPTKAPHRYVLQLWFGWVVWTTVSTSVSGPSSAKAALRGFSTSLRLNMARSGEGIFLDSITYS